MHGDHVIIAGFGLPGRAIARVLDENHTPYCVIELNPEIARRCAPAIVQIITGDVRHEDCLREAGIESASMIAIAIPDEAATLEALPVARKLNPNIRILARCWYTSAGFKALSMGADQVVVAETVVAAEFERFLKSELGKPSAR